MLGLLFFKENVNIMYIHIHVENVSHILKNKQKQKWQLQQNK